MLSKKASDLFEVIAASPVETVIPYNVGFTIPEYQRQYDWSTGHIDRLYFDVLSGFSRLNNSQKSSDASLYTFLGTIILIKESSRAENFTGESLAVVDGQQRLTTLILFACVLCEALKRERDSIKANASVEKYVSDWLNEEIECWLLLLYQCAVGKQAVIGKPDFPFPRIIREGDQRGKSVGAAEYRSPIGRFLQLFSRYFEDKQTIEVPLDELGDGVDTKKLVKNYLYIRELVQNLNVLNWYEDTECEQLNIARAENRHCRELFGRLTEMINDKTKENKAISTVTNNPELHPLIRTILFSSYFCNCIVLTKVKTEDEDAAFDIFDALNTTGAPLTALETLKPRVIRFENKKKKGSYSGSPSEEAIKAIAEVLDDRIEDTSKKQKETKELVVTFALYLRGEKLSKELSRQREFLGSTYKEATSTGIESARRYVTALSYLANFRRYYWERDEIKQLVKYHPSTHEEVQLLISFIRDMGTSLALPIIFRYWDQKFADNSAENNFLEALRAVAGFIIIRRGATGGTDTIDSDLRAIMAPKEGGDTSRKYNLCAGFDNNNEVLSISELKKVLKQLLKHKLNDIDKENWIEKASSNPLARQARVLARFMILTAANQAEPCQDKPGNWTKKGIRPSSHSKKFLSYNTWVGKIYRTVEHVAPEQDSPGWDENIYKGNIHRHRLGNLTLLPQEENSAISNSGWEKKKRVYRALAEMLTDEQELQIQEAAEAGHEVSPNLKQMLNIGEPLLLLEPLRELETWDLDIIDQRGKNIAELCWDNVWPWLN